MSIRITEVPNGVDLGIYCEVSHRPFTRATDDGMFCDAKECWCEKNSAAVNLSSFLSVFQDKNQDDDCH